VVDSKKDRMNIVRIATTNKNKIRGWKSPSIRNNEQNKMPAQVLDDETRGNLLKGKQTSHRTKLHDDILKFKYLDINSYKQRNKHQKLST